MEVRGRGGGRRTGGGPFSFCEGDDGVGGGDEVVGGELGWCVRHGWYVVMLSKKKRKDGMTRSEKN